MYIVSFTKNIYKQKIKIINVFKTFPEFSNKNLETFLN